MNRSVSLSLLFIALLFASLIGGDVVHAVDDSSAVFAPKGALVTDTTTQPIISAPGLAIGPYVFRIIMYLIVLIILIWGGLYLLRRFIMPAGSSAGGLHKSVRVLGQVGLGQRKALYIVEVVDKIIVLGVTEHAVNTVSEITDSGAIDIVKSEFQEGFHYQFSHYFKKVLSATPKDAPK